MPNCLAHFGFGGHLIYRMLELDDMALLRQYTEGPSEDAFGSLVARQVNAVYSDALGHASGVVCTICRSWLVCFLVVLASASKVQGGELQTFASNSITFESFLKQT